MVPVDVLRGDLVTFEVDHADVGHLEPATRISSCLEWRYPDGLPSAALVSLLANKSSI